MNNSNTVKAMMESATVALNLDASINNIDPCKTKDYFDETNGFEGQPGTGIQIGYEIRVVENLVNIEGYFHQIFIKYCGHQL